jgi:hypothetical protein
LTTPFDCDTVSVFSMLSNGHKQNDESK